MKKISILALSLMAFSASANTKGVSQIIGDDSRFRITNRNAKTYHDSIGLMRMSFTKLGSFICTGTVVGPRHIITAAHCIYDFKTKEYVQSVKYYPGLREDFRSTKAPFGEFAAKSYVINQKYITSNDADDDLAMLVFSENLPVSPLPIGVAYQSSISISIAGYPGDKPIGELWEGYGNRYPHAKEINAVNHNVDTVGGQSGSAVRNSNKIVGVHSGAITYGGVDKNNQAFFFTDATLAMFKTWIKSTN
jgi:glutamyl endopeptidase